MAYPKLLNLGSVIETELKQYIDDELTRHDAERGVWLSRIQRNNAIYRASQREGGTSNVGNFTGGSSLIIPLAAISLEAIHANEMTTLFGLDHFVSAKLNDRWDTIDASLEELLDHEIIKNGNMYNAIDSALLDKKLHGNGVIEVNWRETTKKAYRDDVPYTVVTERGVIVDSVPIQNYLMPFSAQDEKKSDWSGVEYTSTPYELKCLFESELFEYDKWFKVENWVYTSSFSVADKVTDSTEKAESRVPVWPDSLKWQKVWCSWDVNGDKEKEEICVYYHRDSGTILGVRYNYYDDLRKPFHVVKHFPVPNRWAAIGLVEQVEQFQEEVTTFHRQRIDNATIVNMRMYIAKKMSGISENEPIYPGKIFRVDDMNDFQPIQSAEIYNSAYQMESQSIMYVQQRTGVNELTLGMPQVGTPGTASSDLARVQEGKKKFDYVYRHVRNFADSIVTDCLYNIAQFGVSDVDIFSNLPNGTMVQDFLKLPLSYLKHVVDMYVAGQNHNKILDRSSWTQLSGILTQYWTNMIQIAQNGQRPELVTKFSETAIISGTNAMRQILESFDTRNIDKMLIDLNLLKNAEGSPGTAAPVGTSGIVQSPGMGFVNPVNTTVGG